MKSAVSRQTLPGGALDRRAALPPGAKWQVLGVVTLALSALVALLAQVLGFELDPFYGLLAAAGSGLVVLGTVRRRRARG